MATTSTAVTTEKQTRVKGREYDVWLVKNSSGGVIGTIHKFRPKRGEWHPYKAFARSSSHTAPSPMLGVFYASDCGSGPKAFQAAINAIVEGGK